MAFRQPQNCYADPAFIRKNGYDPLARPYQEEWLDQGKRFLIFCEGANTEPRYIEGFPLLENAVVTMGGYGSKTSLVKYALKHRLEAHYAGRETWCVFDFDRDPRKTAAQAKDFNYAIELANAHGLKVAWSNDAFELWFVLHFQRLDTALTREELYPILKNKWNVGSFSKDAKTESFCALHYERHRPAPGCSQELAIRRARELHALYDGRKDYSNHCPCTTVYQLVEELNKNCKS